MNPDETNKVFKPIKYDALDSGKPGTWRSVIEKERVIIYITCPDCSHLHRLINDHDLTEDGRSEFICSSCRWSGEIKLMGWDMPVDKINLYINTARAYNSQSKLLSGRRKRTKRGNR